MNVSEIYAGQQYKFGIKLNTHARFVYVIKISLLVE